MFPRMKSFAIVAAGLVFGFASVSDAAYLTVDTCFWLNNEHTLIRYAGDKVSDGNDALMTCDEFYAISAGGYFYNASTAYQGSNWYWANVSARYLAPYTTVYVEMFYYDSPTSPTRYRAYSSYTIYN